MSCPSFPLCFLNWVHWGYTVRRFFVLDSKKSWFFDHETILFVNCSSFFSLLLSLYVLWFFSSKLPSLSLYVAVTRCLPSGLLNFNLKRCQSSSFSLMKQVHDKVNDIQTDRIHSYDKEDCNRSWVSRVSPPMAANSRPLMERGFAELRGIQ